MTKGQVRNCQNCQSECDTNAWCHEFYGISREWKGQTGLCRKCLCTIKLCMDMPVSPVDSISKWKHLTGLDLADPDFGTPVHIDVLLGADYYSETLLSGWRWGPRGTPYAQRTCFGGSWLDHFNLRIPDQQHTPAVCI